MRDFFSMDGTLFRVLSKMADLMILNIIFLICCIPVVTIGASVTALSYVSLKSKDQEEGYVWKSFFRSFRQNFRQSTVIWLLLLALAAVLFMDFRLSGMMEGVMGQAVRIMAGIGGMIWLMLFLYAFPLQARFYNSIGGTMKNALLLALASFPKTLCMMAVAVGAVIVTFLNTYTLWYGMLVWLLLGFSLVAWVNSQFLHGIFLKIMPEEESQEGPEPGVDK